METPAQTANRQIARGAGVVMAAFILSNLVGLARQVLVSHAFGTGFEIDAFNAAARLPDTLFMLVAGGALASSFLPVFADFLTKNEWEGAWHLASALINLVLVVLVIGSALSAFFAPWIVGRFLAPKFPADQQALTVALLRILLISPVIFGASGLSMGVLNAHQKFLLPALAPTMYWLGMIFGVLFLTPALGIHGLAWGAVLGAGGHLAVQLPGIVRLKGRYHLTLGLDDPAVRRVGALLGPRLFGVAVVQLNFWVNVILASGQPVGSLTAIQVAFAVMTMPQVVIAQAIAIAALPTFSAQAARGELAEMRESLAATLRGMILLSLPASLGLILLRFPIVTLLFERGEFDAYSTQLVAWALLWYGAGLVGHSVVEVVSRAFYALHDTRTPVVVGVIAMSLNIVFSIAFAAWFVQIGWPPHGGLALGNSLATGLEMMGLLALMSRRLKGLEGRHILTGALQAGAATLGMSLAVFGWLAATGGASVWLVGLGGIAAGGLVYAVLIYAQKVPEARELVQYALGRLKGIAA